MLFLQLLTITGFGRYSPRNSDKVGRVGEKVLVRTTLDVELIDRALFTETLKLWTLRMVGIAEWETFIKAYILHLSHQTGETLEKSLH